MALVRWEPARELSSLQNEMNRLFGTFFDAPAGVAANGRWIPAMDLVESDDEFVLKADLPGLAEDDVHVEVDGDVLTISGERRSDNEVRKDGVARIERSFGAFRRSLTLPDGVPADRVGAAFDKGVLEVRIPKPEQRRPHTVQIAVGDSPPTIEGGDAEDGS